MKSFQQLFLERLEAEVGEIGFNLISQASAANVIRVDFCGKEDGFVSSLTMEANFHRSQNVFNFNDDVMPGKSNPTMVIVGDNLGEAEKLVLAILNYLDPSVERHG